ncbi:MAG TPA: hypothetical protein VJK72_03295, partial [Candidatus Nanoarchaeia archaeon]|nr:hypothetical protein [Candidatus Nanoarchaeia archaeon]
MKKILFALLFVIACTQQLQGHELEPVMLQPEDTALDHPPTDDDRFSEVKTEIDYWYNKPPRSIGMEHKMQMMNRLLPLDIPKATKDEYVQKLNSILL